MWTVSPVVRTWIQSKEGTWRKPVLAEVLRDVRPAFRFDAVHQPAYKDMKGKTLYVWPDYLIAPTSFSQVALKEKGKDPSRFAEFWKNPKARVYQFLGQDNVFFYILMQGAMWLGTQKDPMRLPEAGELQ